MRSILIIFILIILASCSQKPEEVRAEAIDVALTYLSNGDCDDAIDVLTDAGYDNENAIYLQVLASAYACKANFNEINFITEDLTSIVTTSNLTIFKSLATMSLSDEVSEDSNEYVAVRTGIEVLLKSTSGSPSHSARVTKFGPRKAGDLSVQALILNIVNFGKFLNYYGNVDNDGDKGQGSSTNSCFMNYTDPRAQTVIGGGAGGVCNVNNDGHPDLILTTDDGKRRACEGLVMLTNIMDILDDLDLSSSDSMSALEEIAAKVASFKTTATSAGLGTLINMTSQSACEGLLDTSTLDMQYLYALVFETGLH